MLASIDANKGLNPFGDVIIAYEMNGEDLPRDHGYPLRVIVPGYAAVRNVKWLKKLELAEEEAFGMWQRGLNYKILPPTVLDTKEVDLDIMPGLSEECVFSGITRVENLSHTPPMLHVMVLLLLLLRHWRMRSLVQCQSVVVLVVVHVRL